VSEAPGTPAAANTPVSLSSSTPKPATTPATPDTKALEPIVGEGETKPDAKTHWKTALKDSPWKIRHKGVERSLSDFDPEEATSLIQRGYGATKQVEEANKVRGEAEKILALKKALDEGDDESALEALTAFSGKRGIELLQKLQSQQQHREESLKDVPPEVRQLLEQNETLQRQLQEHTRTQAEQKKAEQKKAHEAEVGKARAEAVNLVGDVLKALNLPPETAPYIERFAVQAMREALEVGLELGVDVPPAKVAARAHELAQSSVFGVLDSIPHGKLYDALGEKRVDQLSREFVRRHKQTKQQSATPAPAPEQKPANGVPRIGDPRYLRG